MASDCSGKIFRKLLIGFGVFVLLALFSSYIFLHLYFSRTFSQNLNGMVIRCSSGLQARAPGEEWQPVAPGQLLEKGELVRTSPGETFLSFSGLRLLSNSPFEIELAGERQFSLLDGSVAVAAAAKAIPFEVSLGQSLLTTNDSQFLFSRTADGFSAECLRGNGFLKIGREEKKIASGEAMLIGPGKVQVAAAEARNPFAAKEISSADRIQKRFREIVSKYLGGTLNSNSDIGEKEKDGNGLQFVSYGQVNLLAQARSMSDYYETLFAPSNRTISIGKQKLVPLTPYCYSSFPVWSNDGSKIAYIEGSVYSWQARARVATLDDLDHPWDISQEYDTVLPFFPIAWAPDDRHVLFMVADHMDFNHWGLRWWWSGPYHIKIASIDPNDGPIEEFDSPFQDIPLPLPLPIGKTISPFILKLPWGDAMLCVNWGNLAYIPIEQNGQSVRNAPGLFLTNFNPREFFVLGGGWSPSGSMIAFTAAEDLNFKQANTYILYDVEDILDGFAAPPRSPDDPRIKRVAASPNPQIPGGVSYDESLVFFQEDVNGQWDPADPTYMPNCDFDLFYADARPDQPSKYTQIHLPKNQLFLRLSPEANRLVYADFEDPIFELRVVTFDIEANMDMDLGGVLIDNSGTNLIVPPGTLEENFKVKISTPFTIQDEAVIPEGESRLFAMRMLDAEGIEKPKFIEPMTLTIRYTDDEVAGLDEGMLEIYYYDENDPANPVWVPLGGTVDPENNEISVEIRHFSSYSVGLKPMAGTEED